MRVLIAVTPVIKRLWGDMKMLRAWDGAMALQQYAAPCFVYFLLDEYFRPQWEERFPEGPPPGVAVVWEPTRRKYTRTDRYHHINMQTLADNFSRRFGLYPVDWVWAFEPEAVQFIKPMISDCSKSYDDDIVRAVPILVQDIRGTYSRSFGQINQHPLDVPFALAKGWGYVQGHPIFPTQSEFLDMRREYEMLLSPWAVKEMKKRTLILSHFINDQVFDQLSQRGPDPIIMFAARLSTNKNIKLLKKIMLGIETELGDQARFSITAPSIQMRTPQIRDFYTTYKSSIQLKVTREKFWQEAAKCHIGICTSELESFGVSFLEQLAAGQAVLFPKAKNAVPGERFGWVDEVYPKWYPWRYETPEEAVAMAADLVRRWNAPDVVESRVQVMDWMNETFRVERYVRKLTNHVKRIEDGELADVRKGVNWFALIPFQQRIVAKAVLEFVGRTFALPALYRAMHRYNKHWADDPMIRTSDAQAPGNYDFYRQLLAWGLEDTHDTAIPIFRVPKIWTPPITLKED